MSRIDDPTPRIEYLRKKGILDSVIVERLVLEGWATDDLFSPFLPLEHTSKNTAGAPTQATAKTHSRFSPSLSTSVLAGAAIMALGFAGYILYQPPVVYSISLPSGGASSSPLIYGALAALSDPDYYEEVKGRFADDRASFIDADLSA